MAATLGSVEGHLLEVAVSVRAEVGLEELVLRRVPALGRWFSTT